MIKVSLSGSKLLSGMTAEEKSRIKDDLAYPNPAFEAAKKHARFGTGGIPPFVNYYMDGKHGMLVPRGYVIPFPHMITEDKRFFNTNVSYPKLCIKLRDTQQEAVDAFIQHYKKNREERGVVILPTGKGKSVLGLYLARKFQQKALIVVQKDDLVDGWTQDAKFVFGLRPKQVGLIKAKEFRIGRQITITTIQTLSKLNPMQIRQLHETFGMIIVDEFHHSAAKIYDMIQYFPARFKIGLTATAMRNDGLVDVLYLHFGGLVYEFQDQANDEDILPVKILIKNAPTVFNPERKYRYDKRKKRPIPEQVPISTIRKATSFDEKFNWMLTTDILKEYRDGKSCVVFTHEKEHCRIIEDTLLRRGVPAESVQLYYGDSKTPKDVMKRRAESRDVLITIATYSIATEGTNVKAWERGFLASTIANEKDTVQAIGRCRRTMPGKKDCLIYDYRFPGVISAKNHGRVRDKVYYERGYETIGKEVTKRKPTGRKNSRKPTGRKRR